MKFIIDKKTDKQRLDIFLAKQNMGLSRAYVQRLIEQKEILVNGLPQKHSYKLKVGDNVTVEISPPKKIEVEAENIPLDVVYEDEDLLVVNKPRGMVTHPAVGNFKGTLVNALLYHIKNLSGIGGFLRPGIIHRLDKDTSGLLLVAKSDFAHHFLSGQMKDRKIKKIYMALVHGLVKQDEGYVQARIGRHPVNRQKMAVIKNPDLKSREALTFFKVIKRYKEFTLVELDLKTGRTHQIRVHMSHIGHPIIGDKTYGGKTKINGMEVKTMLHAKKIGFCHPRTGKYMEFIKEIPDDMAQVLEKICLDEVLLN
ncbi:MAG: 23S rRNA pseudouridine synthase [Candidatus Saganbacteria bacterium]|uniref:Pseudouridine synthase n=1 Tax=Candidatus Saganbacteria bacterium TaxID=2575572 RepID=A0A833L082_UNCSA|nr:MAG: 23S rRNA pseudouridine synthase [Candidatus Saganbacteria bacterium]